MRRRRDLARAGCAALVFLVAAVTIGAAAVVELPGWCANLPYRYEVAATVTIDERTDPCAAAWGDLDGDGFADLVSCTGPNLVCYRGGGAAPRVVWQQPIAPPFAAALPVAALCVDFDLEGDGRPEVVAATRTTDGWRTRFWILDAATGTTKASFDLDGGVDRRPDGLWDGRHIPWGGVPSPDGAGDNLLVGTTVAYDAVGRGIRLVDPRTGGTVWEYAIGPAVGPDRPLMTDVDRDGHREFILTGSGVGNLHGDLVNGTSDDSSRVFVLRDDGRLLWQRAFVPEPSAVHVAAADLDGDHDLEIAVTAQRNDLNTSDIAVVDGKSGAVLAQRTVEGRGRAAVIVEPRPGKRPVLYVNSLEQNAVHELRWIDGGLDVVREHRFPGFHPVMIVPYDLLGDARPELIVFGSQSDAVVCDATLRPLAFIPHTAARPVDLFAGSWRLNDTARLLITNARPREALAIVPAPSRTRIPAVAGTVLVLAGAAVLAWRRRAGSRSTVDDPGVVRELRRQLLGRLQILRHEKFGTLENLERLIWYLGAAQDSDPDDEAGQARIRALVADTRNSTMARLRNIGALSRRVGLPPSRTAALASECDELSEILARIEASSDLRNASSLLPSLAELGAALQRESRLIRAEVESFFRADVLAILAEILRAQADQLAAAAVDVVAGGAPIDPTTWQSPTSGLLVIADRDDVAFILDNLVGNAIRAMSAMPYRQLTITWERTETRAFIRIADTGCGIPPDDWDRVLAGESRHTDSTGLGFRKTQEFLKLYHGQIWIEASQPGGGTTFVVALQAITLSP